MLTTRLPLKVEPHRLAANAEHLEGLVALDARPAVGAAGVTLGGDVGPECAFWNMSVVYESSLCSHFAIGRSASTPARANQRALACAAAFGVECVLSPEIGLALPAAFLYSHDAATMTMVLAPKLLPHASEQVHVRVAPPGGDGLTDTKTLHFNRTVRVEYLEGASRQLRKETLSDDSAFCVQLLRLSFEPECWQKLD